MGYFQGIQGMILKYQAYNQWYTIFINKFLLSFREPMGL